MSDARYEFLDTPDGPFGILADGDQRVLASGWTSRVDDLLDRLHPRWRPASVGEGETGAAAVVADYYSGDLAAIDAVAVLQHGTPLLTRAWAALRTITPGEPLSYTEFAALVGAPGAVRAAASACARNAPALFVPCHRVLRSDGSLGGFAWGLPVKASLLARESSSPA